MSKLSYEDKIEIYNKRKKGVTLSALRSQYGVAVHGIQYLIWLIDKHGFNVLKKVKKLEKQGFIIKIGSERGI